MVQILDFPKFIELSKGLSPSSRGVRGSDYVRCNALTVIFQQNNKFRKKYLLRKKLQLDNYHRKPENSHSHPHFNEFSDFNEFSRFSRFDRLLGFSGLDLDAQKDL